MDFAFDDSNADQYLHEVKLVETKTNRVFYDKLTFIYIEIPKFRKRETELETHFDKWMFLLQNLTKFTEIPIILQERIFRKVFAIAEISNLNEEDMRTYESSLKDKRDWQSALDTAVEEAREQGREQERRKVAKQLKKEGIPSENIARATGLSIEEIQKL